ncbi:hypothetical protein ACKKBF_B13195 [Auxenochlorella protothecoides x Auxenochlorella symbiontica]
MVTAWQAPRCQGKSTGQDASLQDMVLKASQAYTSGNYEACLEHCMIGQSLLCVSAPQSHHRRYQIDLLLLTAVAYFELGQYAKSVAYNDAAVVLDPSLPEAQANLASGLSRLGQLDLAIMYYQSALRLRPTTVAVQTSLATVLQRRNRREAGRVHEAAMLPESGVSDGTLHSRQLSQWASGNRHLGDPSLATAPGAAAFPPSSSLAPAVAARRCQQDSEVEAGAVQAYHLGASQRPLSSEERNDLGNALREAGRGEEAVAQYVACLHLLISEAAQAEAQGLGTRTHARRQSVVYSNLASMLKLVGRAREGIMCYQNAVALQPGEAEGHANLAAALKDNNQHEEAIAAYRQALALRPDFPDAFANLVHSMQCVCDWQDRPSIFQRLIAITEEELAAGCLPSVQPFHAMAYPLSPDLALRISSAYAGHCLRAAAALNVGPLPHPAREPLAPGRRLRIAYVSSDLGNHPLSHLMGSVFGMHDRRLVEVFCYALSADDGSPWRARIRADADHFLDVAKWPSPSIARRISEDGIHIAVNLNGYTRGARSEVFALRPAPIGVSYMGFPATTGRGLMDYIVTDKVVTPDHLLGCYGEAVARMPHSYFVNDHRRAHGDVLRGAAPTPTRTALGLPEDGVVLACANQLYKIDPGVLDAWCRVLRAAPRTVLWLLRFPASGEPRLRAQAAARGVHPARLVFSDVAPKPAHVARCALADLVLDTPACNAHTTACDVLWAGCPLLTLPLERMASRVAASLACASGLGGDMVVGSMAEYEARALELALDAPKRLALRAAVCRARGSSPLFDTRRWVSDFERMLLRMWAVHAGGRRPCHFDVEG